MAISFGRINTISRKTGSSVTAAAAYRAGVVIVDERTGETHDYTRRRGIEHTEILGPAAAPAWMQDRSALWNAAERAEVRSNARVGRDFVIALPHELSPAQRRDAAREMAQWISDRHGVVVDLAIHSPDKTAPNWHAHLLVSTRRMGRDGFTDKARELDDKARGPEEVEAWRQGWTRIGNQALERAGFSNVIDMRSYDRQGIDREGQQHLGKQAAAQEKQGHKTLAGDYNRAVQARNAAREKLENELKILDLEIEREKRRLAADRADRQAEYEQQAALDAQKLDRELYRAPEIEPPDDPDREAAAFQEQREEDARQAKYEKFVLWEIAARNALQDQQNERRGIVGKQWARKRLEAEKTIKEQYGKDRSQHEKRLRQLTQRSEQGNWVTRLIGRINGEDAEREAHQKGLAHIEQLSQGILGQVENQRLESVEAMEKSHRQQQIDLEQQIQRGQQNGYEIPARTAGIERQPANDRGRTMGGRERTRDRGG